MAEKQHKTPFNLLYKVEAQKTTIDRLYEFAVGAGRVIVIFVMLTIIGAFAYRFPLDAKLNDEIKLSDINVNNANLYLDGQNREKEFNAVIERVKAAKAYTEIYKDENATDSENEGKQIKFGTVLEKLLAIDSQFGENIIITDYGFTSDSNTNQLKITGAATTFPKAEEYRESVRGLTEVKEANITSLGSSREGLPRFSIDVLLK